MYKLTVPVVGKVAYANKEETLEELKRCNADRVAIALSPDLSNRECCGSDISNYLKRLEEIIKFFKENDFEVLV